MRLLLAVAALSCAITMGCATTSESSPKATLSDPSQEVFYHIFTRSFRDSNGDGEGDLQGVIEGLDYLRDLGVTSILLTPLYPSHYYHNYFASDFYGIDPEFGTMDDYLRLVAEVHRRGMKIYLDQEMQYVRTITSGGPKRARIALRATRTTSCGTIAWPVSPRRGRSACAKRPAMAGARLASPPSTCAIPRCAPISTATSSIGPIPMAMAISPMA
jgi:hypothetical protein